MAYNRNIPVKQKVYAYILDTYTDGNRLLVFEHVDFPEAGIQVPGGSVEMGESPEDAVIREVREETGIDDLAFVGKIGVARKDMSEFGLNCIHERHYFHFECPNKTPETWIAYEHSPSDGSPAPIAFRFYWADLNKNSNLSGGLGELVDRLP